MASISHDLRSKVFERARYQCEYCQAQQQIVIAMQVDHILPQVARHDAELERAFAQAGRNDPCPCGSGKKFKRCHGRRRR